MVLNFPVKEGLQEIVSRFFAEIEEEAFEEAVRAVTYTHLTLPTN